MDNGSALTASSVDETAYVDASFLAFKAILRSLSDSTQEFLAAEIMRIFQDENVKLHLKEAMPYIYAAGFLSFSGREINEDNMAKTLRSVGMVSDPEVMRLLFKANVRSHLVYIYAYYFLLSLGKIGSEAEIVALVSSLGIEADESRINDVLAFLKTPQGTK
ncbi:MAG: hypothetical protein KGH57_00490 [Candidatus Micrarchaeota archaeon]|nr:hypothetical protein [Candidatus Micrarchaeota archaeon]